ncbi:general secretion pathway protein GspD [Flaviramulus sp. BrNp1-15]|uniref:type II secretion system protein GspD n=1 Tax=Flaviramulus sp. BrNp1-15 TaxID=2916754 RepID=UPI001EE9A071|nr:general secretion pathway protein GspD [Flaviramulus sp. BrNp1-15]ULC57916.1 general secretion pathway protein GspD [Flaviramulus sp. BrNp1-15]
MKKLIWILLLSFYFGLSQNDHQRFSDIKNQLELLSTENSGLAEQAKTEISVSNISLANFILAISNAHAVNINISPELNQITIANNNFSNVTVSDLLVFLCKEYNLTIDFTGSILSIKKYTAPTEIPEERIIPIQYNPDNNTITINAQNDKLFDVFKRIMDESAKNLVFTPGLENKILTSYIKDMPFDTAMQNLAFSNNLYTEKTNENFYLFEDNSITTNTNPRNYGGRQGDTSIFKVLDLEKQLLEVDFNHTPIKTIINDIGNAFNIDIFTATPLDKGGTVTFRAKSISFDDLLNKIFESFNSASNINPQANTTPPSNTNNRQNNNPIIADSNIVLTFKKEGNIYYFGTENQLSVRKVEVIHLMHRSVELLSDPLGGSSRSRTVGRSNYNNANYNNYSSYNQNYNSNSGYNNNSSINNSGLNRNRTSSNISNYNNTSSGGASQTIEEIIPVEIAEGLDIKIDHELNSLYVTGTSTKIERLKNFIQYIDKTVPVVLIEVMFVEVNKSNIIESGVTWGIGDEPAETKGAIFPKTDFTLGARTINKVINGFDGFDRINLGKVVPNFFATVKAMESNGNLKIKSTPKLSTLNGHRATFSNGETSYYTVTQRNIYGTDNPQTSEITNYEPIDAELGLTIKPLVSGDGQVTLDIFVIQSSFGTRIDENAPPDISSREFSSIIRVQDQDIVVLGGLEEQVKNDSGSGVPFLARVPVIKWLFSSRKREASKAKLTVFIKPTIIY